MARTPAQRGTFGRWLTRVRSERYDRQVDALDAMRKLAGLHISQAEYSQWESGSRVPRPDNPKVARLYEFFGSQPEDETGPAQMDGAGQIVGAIDELRKAVEAQTRLLETAFAATGAGVETYAQNLQELLTRLVAEHVGNQAEREREPAAGR